MTGHPGGAVSFFSRFFRKHARAPEWARFFTDAEYTSFLAAVEAALSKRDLPFELGDGLATVHPPSGEPHRLGLQNLADVLEATDGRNEIHVDPEIGRQAKRSIDRMLDFAAAKKAKALPTGSLEQETKLFNGIGPA